VDAIAGAEPVLCTVLGMNTDDISFVFETAVSNENGFPNALVGIKTVGGKTSYDAI
jgi:hypothetical protein